MVVAYQNSGGKRNKYACLCRDIERRQNNRLSLCMLLIAGLLSPNLQNIEGSPDSITFYDYFYVWDLSVTRHEIL